MAVEFSVQGSQQAFPVLLRGQGDQARCVFQLNTFRFVPAQLFGQRHVCPGGQRRVEPVVRVEHRQPRKRRSQMANPVQEDRAPLQVGGQIAGVQRQTQP